MEQSETIELIDNHKNKLIDPVKMLHWTWLRVIINSIAPDEWEKLVNRTNETMSK